jgi:Carboxypeptidase regulatory-like domain
VKNAFVVVNTSQGSLSDFSTTDGSFLIDLVPDGPAELSAGSGSKIATKNLTVGFGINDAGDLTLQPDPNPNPPAPLKTIFGKVTSATDGSAVASAPVFLLRNSIQLETINTDAAGDYFFIVPAGSYSVQVIPGGYVTETKTAELLNPNNPLTINFSLTPR